MGPINGIDLSAIRLDGWKAIAVHLGKHRHTAMQLAAEGMPVRRAGGGVFAYVDEIDAWLRARPTLAGAA